jgi:hypothetical protein
LVSKIDHYSIGYGKTNDPLASEYDNCQVAGSGYEEHHILFPGWTDKIMLNAFSQNVSFRYDDTEKEKSR